MGPAQKGHETDKPMVWSIMPKGTMLNPWGTMSLIEY